MILQEGINYTFSQIFELSGETDEVLADLGYSYQIAAIDLPVSLLHVPETLQTIGVKMRERLPLVPLTNETARREFYVAPFLFAVLDEARFKMSIEYNITTQRLRGDVDYLLRGTNNIAVVEAKRADTERGFTQLAAELIALATYRPEFPNLLYGAVTTGELWRFGLLDRASQTITKDLDVYLLPRDLERLFNIFLALLA